MAINWDKLTDEEIKHLHKVRKRTEKYIASVIMRFEKVTGLEVDDISMYREVVPILEDDGTIREPDPKNISVQMRVPMRLAID